MPVPTRSRLGKTGMSAAKAENFERVTFLLRKIGAARTARVSKNLKNISVVASLTLVSRVFGLVRDSLAAAVFGTSALASAFFTAFQLPNLFRRLLGEGALTAAFVPTLNDELHKRQREGAFKLVNEVSTWLLLVSSGVVAIAMLTLSQPAWLEALGRAGGAEADTIGRWLQGAELAVVLFPYLIFVCMAAAFSAALQTLGRFLEPALSPVWLNVAMIGLLGGAVWLRPELKEAQMNALCAGVLIGGFLQMAVPAWALMREGWRPRFSPHLSEPVRGILRLMGPTLLGSAVYLINMTVSRFIGLSLNDSAVAVLNFAQRLMELPIGVFAIAVTTVVFPLITRYASQGDFTAMGAAYRKGMRLILAVNLPAAVGLAVLAEPVIRLLFQRGEFNAADTHAMMPVLAVSAAGLPFLAFANLALRAFYAEKDTVTPVRAAVLSFVVNVALSFALMGKLSTTGLAFASTLATVVQAWFLQRRLAKRRPELALAHLGGDLVKILVASALMGGVVWGGWYAWTRFMPVSVWSDAAAVGSLVAGGVVVYGAIVWSLRLEGREEIIQMVRQKLSGRNA
jgi:putative peptidoglycan lipid II flippase